MKLIKVIAKMVIKEDKVEEFKNIVKELVAETRKEEGCMIYELFQDVNNKNELSFVEEWESSEALQKHMNSKHFQEALPKFAEIQEKKPEISICTLVM